MRSVAAVTSQKKITDGGNMSNFYAKIFRTHIRKIWNKIETSDATAHHKNFSGERKSFITDTFLSSVKSLD